jgi:hypothetical protein
MRDSQCLENGRKKRLGGWGKRMQGGRSGPSGSKLWYLLLLVPYLAMIWVSSYNTAEPAWAGIPFFYWYQLLWIWIASALTLIVYFATSRGQR